MNFYAHTKPIWHTVNLKMRALVARKRCDQLS